MPKNDRQFMKIDQLSNWEDNPRSIKEKGFKRLKKQIKKFGQYKPLIVTKDGVVLGGNMRLRAYRDLGINEVWVSIVDAPTRADKIQYALSDNDSVGFYDQQKLAELLHEIGNDFDWESFKVQTGRSYDLKDILDKFAPSDSDDDKKLTYEEQYQVVVDCKNEIEQQEIYQKLVSMGYKCRVLTI